LQSYEIWAGRFLWATEARVPLSSNNPHSAEGEGGGGCERGRNIDPKEKSNVKSSPYSEG